MFFDPLYFVFALPGLAFVMLAQWRVKAAFNRYSRVPTRRGMTGRDVALAILRSSNIQDVRVESVSGFLSDHYDPRSKTLRLSPDVYGGRSVAAAGIAAHEVGHAIQHARAYAPLQMRSALVPVLSLTNSLAMPLIFGGFLLMFAMPALGQLATIAGVALFGVAVLFQVVTLPVEIDASRRALAAIDQGKILTGDEYTGARRVLTAAAWTYVAAAASSALTLLYYLVRLGLIGGRDD